MAADVPSDNAWGIWQHNTRERAHFRRMRKLLRSAVKGNNNWGDEKIAVCLLSAEEYYMYITDEFVTRTRQTIAPLCDGRIDPTDDSAIEREQKGKIFLSPIAIHTLNRAVNIPNRGWKTHMIVTDIGGIPKKKSLTAAAAIAIVSNLKDRPLATLARLSISMLRVQGASYFFDLSVPLPVTEEEQDGWLPVDTTSVRDMVLPTELQLFDDALTTLPERNLLNLWKTKAWSVHMKTYTPAEPEHSTQLDILRYLHTTALPPYFDELEDYLTYFDVKKTDLGMSTFAAKDIPAGVLIPYHGTIQLAWDVSSANQYTAAFDAEGVSQGRYGFIVTKLLLAADLIPTADLVLNGDRYIIEREGTNAVLQPSVHIDDSRLLERRDDTGPTDNTDKEFTGFTITSRRLHRVNMKIVTSPASGLFMSSIRDIAKGERLYTDYGDTYFLDSGAIIDPRLRSEDEDRKLHGL